MRRLKSDVLDDPRYRGPLVPPVACGVAWLRAHVARFCEGEAHRRRRQLAVSLIDGLTELPAAGSPTVRILAGLGLPQELEPNVALVAAAYQPHAPESAAADAAADRLVAGWGGGTGAAAAPAGILAQAHAAPLPLADPLRSGSDAPPAPDPRRIAPDGVEVLVDLADAPFGRGAHRCPGQDLALELAHDHARQEVS